MGLVISNYYGGTARAIAKALGWKVSLADSSKLRKVPILNYGTTSRLVLRGATPYLNHPGKVGIAVDKRLTLEHLSAHDVPCIAFTVEPVKAKEWLAEGRSVVCRKVLNGHSGQGIDIIKWEDWKRNGRGDPRFPAGVKLFTKYFPKREEVRVHVFNGEVIAYARKMARNGADADNWVRSHANGWVFGVDGVVRDERACVAAVAAVRALGLHFGGVDIGIGRDGVAVFEVNSAPGMEGRTLEAYVAKFKQHFGVR
jgi:glutathione synthase/RimK-type ligase-like ATP-grasp enzyme